MVTNTTLTKELDTAYYLRTKKPLLNAIAISYTLISYGVGVALLLPNSWVNSLGVVLLTHSLVLSAYLAHEFMHCTIFDDLKWNTIWGSVMLWLNGGCYARFRDLATEHIGHHVNRVDFSAFNLPTFINHLPRPIRQIILGLEWLYFPAISFLLQWRGVVEPFRNPKRYNERLRVSILLIVRGFLFTLLGLVSLKALFLYFVAYVGMTTILRLMDAFQHTYEVFPVSTPLPKRDRAYEQANTFSTLFSQRYWWLNLLLLNFGYHNAHHELMKCPWHNLRQLDRDLFTGKEVHYLSFFQLLKNYHQYRISRIFSGQGQANSEQGQLIWDTFYGAVGVSLLVKF